MKFNSCFTFFRNQAFGNLVYCRTDWVRSALQNNSSNSHLNCHNAFQGCFDRFYRTQLSSYTERPWWDLRCKWSKLVCSVSRFSHSAPLYLLLHLLKTIQWFRVNHSWQIITVNTIFFSFCISCNPIDNYLPLPWTTSVLVPESYASFWEGIAN
jgi:hypothetical protein